MGTLGTDVDVVAAVAAAIDNGLDPLDDNAVRRAATGNALVATNIAARGGTFAAEQIATVLVEEADAILEGFAPVVAKAGQTLLEAIPHLPDDLTSTGDEVRRGAEATDQWNAAQAATATVRAALHDRMTQAVLTDLNDAAQLFTRQTPAPLARAASYRSGPLVASTALLPLMTVVPAATAWASRSRAGSVPASSSRCGPVGSSRSRSAWTAPSRKPASSA